MEDFATAAATQLDAAASRLLQVGEAEEAGLATGTTASFAAARSAVSQAWTSLEPTLSALPGALHSSVAAAQAAAGANLQGALALLATLGVPLESAPFLLSGTAASLTALTLVAATLNDDPDDPAFWKYDPESTLKHYSKRPGALVARASFLALQAGSLLVAQQLDKLTGASAANESLRARQLREALTACGPAFVKIGQVLSSRVDLLSPTYVTELRKLQDSVAPFPEPVARAIMAQDLPPGMFLSLSPFPVASASLGQVYKGVLAADGRAVAVKVQRPGLAAAIALDLLLLRLAAPPYMASKKLNTDLVALVDEWGSRFVDELDYRKEAAAGEAFRAAMAARPLHVTAAATIPAGTTRRVLTTAWVEGVRIDADALPAAERQRMVEVALAAYLTMLLDTGVLHADPHPGNLLRTPEGELVVLDWGLVTPVAASQQAAILSYIAHLIGKDFGAIGGDLVAMGFVPPSKMAAMDDSGVVSVLADVFRALAKGGGARKVSAGLRDINTQRKAAEAAAGGGGRVDALAKDISYVQETYGNILQIPSYFAYILRSFSVLEGIGLAADADFAIASSCYPYIAQRLLSDASPGSTAALEGILYGPAGPAGNLDARRVRQLATAFRSFSSVAAGAAPAEPAPDAAPLGPAAREALRLAFAPGGGPLQRVAVRELARLAGSGAARMGHAVEHSAAGQAWGAAAAQQAAAAQAVLGSLQLQGPWARLGHYALAPLALPVDAWAAAAPLVRETPDDTARLETAAELADILFGAPSDDVSPAEPPAESVEVGARVAAAAASASRFVQAAAPMLPELAPGMAAAALRLGSELMGLAAQRLATAQGPRK